METLGKVVVLIILTSLIWFAIAIGLRLTGLAFEVGPSYWFGFTFAVLFRWVQEAIFP